MMRKVTLLGLLAAMLMVLAACGGGGSSTPSGSGTEGGESNTGGTTEGMTPLETTLTADNELAYKPNEITAKVGQEVSITLNNTGALEHNLVWDDATPDAPFLYTAAGSQDTDVRTFDAAGTYGFYCSIPGHKEAGMTGQVIVE